MLFSLLFYWWYAHPEFFVLQFLGFLLLALQNRRLFYAGLTGLLSLWVLISFTAGYPLGMDILGRLFLYFGIPISSVESKSVPEVLKTISEQGRVSFYCKVELNRDTGTYTQTIGKSSTEYSVKEVFWIEEEGKVKRESFNNPKGGTLYLVKKKWNDLRLFCWRKIKKFRPFEPIHHKKRQRGLQAGL